MTDNNTTSETSNAGSGREERYARIGNILKQARLQAGIDIETITRQLHLPKILIDDIETGRIESQPAIYRRGYIANYARLVGLDPAEVLSQAGTDQPPELHQVLPIGSNTWKFERYLKIATYALVTTVIVPPLLYFFIQGGSRMMEREPVVESVIDEAVSADPGQERPGRQRIARALSLEETDAERPVSASVLPLSPMRPARESEREAGEGGLLTGPVIESLAGPPLEESPARQLRIELTEDSWIEIHDSEGRRLEYDLLRAGQQREYEGEPPFRLLLGRASAVKIMLDGEPVHYDGQDRSDVALLELLASGEVQR